MIVKQEKIRKKVQELEDGWFEVGRKGAKGVLSVQIREVSTNPNLILFRYVNLDSGNEVGGSWIVEKDLVVMFYCGLAVFCQKDDE
jgi:hypothetical protein